MSASGSCSRTRPPRTTHSTSPSSINFIDSTDRVVATATPRVGGVGAGSNYYLGGSAPIPDATPVSKLEIVTRIGSQAPRRMLGPPTSDVLVQASRFEPGWVGGVVGQVLNDHPTMLLSSTQISAVVYNSAGEVIGGGIGYSAGGLLPACVRTSPRHPASTRSRPTRPSRPACRFSGSTSSRDSAT